MAEFLEQNWFALAGLLISIPLGIAVNWLTPRFTRWAALRSIRAAEKRIERIKRQIGEIDRMMADPGYATLKISQVVLYHSLASIGAVLTIFAAAFMMLEGMFVDSSKFCLPCDVPDNLTITVLAAVFTGCVAFMWFRSFLDFNALHERIASYSKWKAEKEAEIELLQRSMQREHMSL